MEEGKLFVINVISLVVLEAERLFSLVTLSNLGSLTYIQTGIQMGLHMSVQREILT